MGLKTTIEINEAELTEAILSHIERNYGDYKVKDIIFRTGVKGDYDLGNAKEYVKKVICKVSEV